MKNAKICLILNPRSGEANKLFHIRPLEDIVEFFSSRELSITIKITIAAGDGTQLASESAEQGYTHIIACGGDGTINEVVNGIAGKDVVMGIIPMGTENVLAKAMGVPLDTMGACEHFTAAGERTMDLGIANGRNFIIMAGIGLDAKVIAEMDPQMKNILGSLGFILKGAMSLFLENQNTWGKAKIRLLDVDEEYEYPFWLILAGNLSHYSGTIKLALKASSDDGKLDIVVFPFTDMGESAKQVLGVFTGTHLESCEIPYFKAKEFEITTEPQFYYQLDGELVGRTPVHFKVNPGALKVRF